MKILFAAIGFAAFSTVSWARDFTYLDYDDIVVKMEELQEEYPNLIKVTTAQEEYGLASPGDCGGKPCLMHYLHLTNLETYESDKAERPEVFFSGAIHGNERVGPTATIEFVELLAEAHTTGSNPWLKKLVDTRSIYVMPMANSLGYYRNEREEDGIDPNRDFAFDYPEEDTDRCMNSITARSMNELWRDHMFQMAITFHSGIRMIGYEWGDVSRFDDYISPDDYSQASLGASLSAYAGRFEEKSPIHQNPPGGFPPIPDLYDRYTYPNGPITPLIYPVRGGMEDWGYAASWADNSNVCTPTRNGGYPVEKTIYDEGMLRCFNILVEADDDKIPPVSTLGSDDELLRPNGEGQGHIARHVKMMLAVTEAVEPYVELVGISKVESDEECSAATLSDIDSGIASGYEFTDQDAFSFSYEIGGSFTVDQTFVALVPLAGARSLSKEDLIARILNSRQDIIPSESHSGFTRWSGGGLFGSDESTDYQNFLDAYAEVEFSTTDDIDDRAAYPFIPAWKGCFKDIPAGEYAAIAVAFVDSNWADIPDEANPSGIGLQAHVSQRRTNESWFYENNGFIVQGRIGWGSNPVPITIIEGASNPTQAPVDAPVASPTKSPVPEPTEAPVAAPTESPVQVPVATPTLPPVDAPVGDSPSVGDFLEYETLLIVVMVLSGIVFLLAVVVMIKKCRERAISTAESEESGAPIYNV